MVLTEKVKVKIATSNIQYYKNIGYPVNLGDEIVVNYYELPKKSNIEIEIKCDICGIEKKSTNNAYNRYLNSSPDNKYRCVKCKSDMRLETMFIKYGSYSNVDKYKKTLEEKYGGHYNKLEEFKDKIKNTNIRKYGHEYGSSSDMVKEKIKKSNLEKYGDEFYINTVSFKQNLIKNYGVDNPLKSDEIRLKVKKTTIERYGVDNISKLPEIKRKKEKNNIDRYGIKYIFQNEDFRKLNYDIAKHPNYIKYVGENISLFKCDKLLSHDFEIDNDNYWHRMSSNNPLCTFCNPIGESNSIKEDELYNFIKENYSGKIIQSYRDQLEVDIYLPDLKLGFEFNGIYWHSDKYKHRNYHLNKTNFFRERGIRIIHIWEDDWVFKTEITKSVILNKIKIGSSKIFARKCTVSEIKNSKIVKDFLNQNHIQGHANSIIKIGLYYDNDLISVMTFDRSEGRKKMNDDEWNLSRFCNKINTNVIGGASKLLNYFIKNYNPTRIISYADRNWSIGELYDKLGFERLYESNPDYKYIIKNKRVHKSKYRKSYTGVSESKLEIPKIWDCGKIKYEKNI
jgi:hypothetical protein